VSDSEQQDIIPSAQPVAPPTLPGAIAAPRRPSNWPAVIGTIAIVFGCLGCLQGVLGALSPLMTAFLAPFMVEEQAEIMQQSAVWNVTSSVVGLMIAVLLFVGGIRITRKRRRAVSLLKGWAIAKILFTLIATIVGYQSAQLQMEAVQNDPNVAFLGAGFFKMFGVVGMILGLLWMCALPVFVLVWFSRRKIKSETESWA